jgi:hypothetical protein
LSIGALGAGLAAADAVEEGGELRYEEIVEFAGGGFGFGDGGSVEGSPGRRGGVLGR